MCKNFKHAQRENSAPFATLRPVPNAKNRYGVTVDFVDQDVGRECHQLACALDTPTATPPGEKRQAVARQYELSADLAGCYWVLCRYVGDDTGQIAEGHGPPNDPFCHRTIGFGAPKLPAAISSNQDLTSE